MRSQVHPPGPKPPNAEALRSHIRCEQARPELSMCRSRPQLKKEEGIWCHQETLTSNRGCSPLPYPSKKGTCRNSFHNLSIFN